MSVLAKTTPFRFTMKLLQIFLCISAASLTGCNRGDQANIPAATQSSLAAQDPAQAPVDVQVLVKHDTLGTEYNGNVAVGPGLAITWDEVHIVTKADKVAINDVVVNRGHCVVPSRDTNFPTKLAFGEQLDIPMHGCDVIEVVVKTDQGNWTASFN